MPTKVVVMLIIIVCLELGIECGYVKQSMEQLMFLLALKFEKLSGLRMLEFGDQVYYGHDISSLYEPEILSYNFSFFDRPLQSNGSPIAVKEYFIKLGINYTSIDWNGKNGALKFDCREDLYQIINEKFDIITNLGFTEHVGENDVESNLVENQYKIFKNYHNFGKIGTLYFHKVPRNFHWSRHGVCDYDTSFFNELVRKNKYEIVLAPTYLSKGFYLNKNMILVSFMKVNDQQFMKFEEFKNLPGLRSKYSDWNIRYATVEVVRDDGSREVKILEVDTAKTSIEIESFEFCSKNVPVHLQDDCLKLIIESLKKDSFDNQYS